MGIFSSIKDKFNPPVKNPETTEYNEAKTRLLKDAERAQSSCENAMKTREKLLKLSQDFNINDPFFTRWNKNYLQTLIDDKNAMDSAIYQHSADALKAFINANLIKKQLELIRPNTEKDILERTNVMQNFASQLNNIDGRNLTGLCFHATSLATTESIINYGGIFSSVDRFKENCICPGFMQTTNLSNEISVSKLQDLQYSINYWADLDSTAYNNCLPAGCIFVLKPQTSEEIAMTQNRQMHNVDFRNQPEKLFGIITTEENKQLVQDWMEAAGFDKSLVSTYAEFPKIFELAVEEAKSEKFNKVTTAIYGGSFEGSSLLEGTVTPDMTNAKDAPVIANDSIDVNDR